MRTGDGDTGGPGSARSGATLGALLTSMDTRPAVLAPGRMALDHAGLHEQLRRTAGMLAAAGLTSADTVALVLPNGPEMTTAFLAVATCAVAAPLNPAYRDAEFTFYLEDLRPELLIVASGYDGPARDVATRLSIPVASLTVPHDAPAGVFNLDVGGETSAPSHLPPREPGDRALLLHTSGTTSRPKIVPLSQENLAVSAANIGRALALGPDDRCLSVMPQFHIHGLVAATLAPLAARGSVSSPSGFDALHFLRWVESERPTWYTAVPTMHQAVLARARRQPEQARAAGLRLIRSSSASLPPAVYSELAEMFACPVIESYGMTEAAHQMTSNPLGAGQQKPGSVGVAAGPEVCVVDEAGVALDSDDIGEITISGTNVTAGYVANEEANAGSFFVDSEGRRWFRTGDQGRFDVEGYLYITGRLKELINRAGEKIAPREVDDVLAEFPGVEQAVTFAIRHKSLGEDVAAAIVLVEGMDVDLDDLRGFARARLAAYKVPRKILVVDEIPKGSTGKLQRIGLARLLGLEEADA